MIQKIKNKDNTLNDFLLKQEVNLIIKSCKNSLHNFGSYVDPIYYEKFTDAFHAKIIAEHLEAFYRGDIKRLFIGMPPRHGKSYLTSRLFPPWVFGNKPKANIILATYGADLSEDFSRYHLNLMRSEEYKDIFPEFELDEAAQSAKRYQTTQGGLCISCGVGGPIYGRGADYGLIDDPIKDWEQARSNTQLDHIWDWYKGFVTRLHKGGGIAIAMHRWRDIDLVGRILERDKEFGEWTTLMLSAVGELTEIIHDPLRRKTGEALWPTEYDEKELARIKREVGSRVWSAQYQQNPINNETNLFPDPIYEEPPQDPETKQILLKTIMGYLDPAYSDGDNADFCALTIGSESKYEQKAYILAGYIWRATIDKSYDKIEAFYKQHNLSLLIVEINKDEGAVAYELRKRGLNVQENRAVKNKYLRITDNVLKNWSSIRFSRAVTNQYMTQVLEYYELAQHDDAPDSLAAFCERIFVAKPGMFIFERDENGKLMR
jgi:hypothetical protein